MGCHRDKLYVFDKKIYRNMYYIHKAPCHFQSPAPFLLCLRDKSLEGTDEMLHSVTEVLLLWRLRGISEHMNDIFKALLESMSLVQNLSLCRGAPMIKNWQGYSCFTDIIKFMTIHMPWCNFCLRLLGLSIYELCTLLGLEKLLTRHRSEKICPFPFHTSTSFSCLSSDANPLKAKWDYDVKWMLYTNSICNVTQKNDLQNPLITTLWTNGIAENRCRSLM